MSSDERKLKRRSENSSVSLDSWALVIASVLALAVKFGLLKNVPW
jgi:hypothetical protein